MRRKSAPWWKALSHDDETKRVEAYQELTRYGPGLWPVLERLIKDQPVEAQVRMRELLKSRIQPTLGGMTLVDGRMRRDGAPWAMAACCSTRPPAWHVPRGEQTEDCLARVPEHPPGTAN